MANSKGLILTERYQKALRYAFETHALQRRKGTAVPYVSHLMSVSSLVLEDGGGETEAIAALLHDAAEDCGGEPRLEDIRLRFGGPVADIVAACTDSLAADPTRKDSWHQRKRAYLKHLNGASREELRVSCADKLHNARCILTDLRTHGPKLWDRFLSGGGKTNEEIMGYYVALSEVFNRRLKGSFLPRELDGIVTTLSLESEITPDTRWIERSTA